MINEAIVRIKDSILKTADDDCEKIRTNRVLKQV
jgi:hypothetical protein